MDDLSDEVTTWHDAAMTSVPDTLYARTLAALQDATVCPACTTPLRSGRCPACGLDVSGPDGLLVWQDSQAAVRALQAREHRIATVRAAQAARRTAPAAAAAPAPQHVAAAHAARTTAPGAPVTSAPPARVAGTAAATGGGVPAAVPPTTQVPAAPAPAATSRPAAVVPATPPHPASAVRRARPTAPAPARRPWRVQTILQVVGASLLAAASITFLVFAWDVMGLRGRAAVVAVGTLVVFALASWLRSRALRQGAEAVGAVAVVLLLLDAWALRATGVVAVGDGTGQAAASLLVCALLLTVWGARSHLRIGAAAGAVLLPLAPLAWLPVVPRPVGTVALLLAAAATTLVRAAPPWSAGRVERLVLRGAAALTLGLALPMAAVATLLELWSAPWSLVALLAAAVPLLVAQLLVDAGRPPAATPGHDLGRAWAGTAGTVLTVAVAAAAATATVPAVGTSTAVQAAAVGACLTAGALLLLRPRPSAPVDAAPVPTGAATSVAGHVHTATTAALATAATIAVWPVLVLGAQTAVRLAPDAADAPTSPVATLAPTLAVVVAVALAVLTLRRLTGEARRLARVAAHGGVALVVATSPVTASALVPSVAVLPVVVLGAAAAVAALHVSERRLHPSAARTGAVLAATLGVLAALPDPAWVAVALLAPTVLAVLARRWSSGPASAGGSTLVAASLLLAAGTCTGAALGLAGVVAAALVVAPVGGALLVRALVRGTGAAERDAALTGAALGVGVTWFAAVAHAAAADGPSPLTVAAPVVAATTALAVVVVLLLGSRRWGSTHAVLGAAALAPVLALTVVTLHAATGVPSADATALAAVVVGGLTAACAVLLARTREPVVRYAAEVTGWLVATAGVGAAAALGAPGPALLVAAVAAAAWSLAPGRSSAWWLTLALGTAAWWSLLGAERVGTVEPYTAVPGLVVAAVGAWRVVRARRHAPRLLVAGLAFVTVPTALLPGALTVGPWSLDRGSVAAALAALVVTAALAVRRRPEAGELLAGLGALLVVLGPVVRSVSASLGLPAAVTAPSLPDGTVLVEVWAWPAAVALVLCARRVRAAAAQRAVSTAGPWALLVVTTLPTLLMALADLRSGAATVRALLVSAAAAGLALLGGATGRRLHLPSASPQAPGRGVGLAGLGLALTAVAAGVGGLVLTALSPTWTDALGGAADLTWAVAGLVALAVVTLTTRRAPAPDAWLVAGLVALVPTLVVRGGDARPLQWGLTTVALLAMARLAAPTAAPDGAAPAAPRARRALALGAAVVATAGPWLDAVVAAVRPGGGSPLRVELVAALTCLVGAAAVRLASAGRHRRTTRATLVTLLVLPTLLAVDATGLGTARVLVVAAGAAALAWWRASRGDVTLGLVVATGLTVAVALRGGPEPADLPWALLGVLAAGLGVRRLREDAAARSWPVLGAPVALAVGAPLAALWLAGPGTLRLGAVLLLALAATGLGATLRWQAPFAIGVVSVLTTLVVVLSPVTVRALADVDGWVLLAVGGAVVLGLGLTYERRVREAKEAVRFVADMR
ncbi:hypothetical protein ATM99_14040 [Cellulomonas sp. B6]|nr:hypothetical protein ATM99_14040 [Cellulomonas sp. B6]